MKGINNSRRTIKSPFINRLLIKPAFVSGGWLIASRPVVGCFPAADGFGVKQELTGGGGGGTCAQTSRHKTETHSRPNEFPCLPLSALCGFIIITLLMHNASIKGINTTSLHTGGCRGRSYSLCLPGCLSFSSVFLLLCHWITSSVSLSLSPLTLSHTLCLSLFHEKVRGIRASTTNRTLQDKLEQQRKKHKIYLYWKALICAQSDSKSFRHHKRKANMWIKVQKQSTKRH